MLNSYKERYEFWQPWKRHPDLNVRLYTITSRRCPFFRTEILNEIRLNGFPVSTSIRFDWRSVENFLDTLPLTDVWYNTEYRPRDDEGEQIVGAEVHGQGQMDDYGALFFPGIYTA